MRFVNRKHVPIESLEGVRLSPLLACAHGLPCLKHASYAADSSGIVLSLGVIFVFLQFAWGMQACNCVSNPLIRTSTTIQISAIV
jgi:hypothetical protein